MTFLKNLFTDASRVQVPAWLRARESTATTSLQGWGPYLRTPPGSCWLSRLSMVLPRSSGFSWLSVLLLALSGSSSSPWLLLALLAAPGSSWLLLATLSLPPAQVFLACTIPCLGMLKKQLWQASVSLQQALGTHLLAVCSLWISTRVKLQPPLFHHASSFCSTRRLSPNSQTVLLVPPWLLLAPPSSPLEKGKLQSPSSLLVWIGDGELAGGAGAYMQEKITSAFPEAALVSYSWCSRKFSQTSYWEGFNLTLPEVLDGSFFHRDQDKWEDLELNMLRDIELDGRLFADLLELRLGELGLDWSRVVVMGFGKGAGIALYAALLFPKCPASMVFFSPIVMFPSFLQEKMAAMRKGVCASKNIFIVWGRHDTSTPSTYRMLLAQMLQKAGLFLN